jgi:hypothetical protein
MENLLGTRMWPGRIDPIRIAEDRDADNGEVIHEAV